MSETMKGIILGVECFTIFCSYPFAIMLCEHIEKKRKNKIMQLRAIRREEHKRECELAGRKLLNQDNLRKMIAENDTKKQTIKYTGYFSGEEVENALERKMA